MPYSPLPFGWSGEQGDNFTASDTAIKPGGPLCGT